MFTKWAMTGAAAIVFWLAPVSAAQIGRGSRAGRLLFKNAKAAKNGNTPIDKFMQMSPEERRKALNRLPPEQRKRLQERLQKFNNLPPERQEELKNLYNRLNQLPAERQQAVRRSLNQFARQPADRKQAIRRELRSMSSLSSEEREARMASQEFQGDFSDKEQKIVRGMSELLPPK